MIKKLARRAGYAGRLFSFSLLRYGTLTGVVALNRGIVFSPDMRLRLGTNVWLGAYGIFQGEGRVSIGDRTYIGHHFFIGGSESVEIGADCMLANFVSIVDSNHGIDPSLPFNKQPLVLGPVVIEAECWIAEKATILAGTRIGRGSIVAAGAVVTKDVAPGTLVAGVPARVVRRI